MPATRRRVLPFKGKTGGRIVTQVIGRPLSTSVTTQSLDLSGTQSTTSEGHPFHSRTASTRLSDLGGNFTTTKSYVDPHFKPTMLGGGRLSDDRTFTTSGEARVYPFDGQTNVRTLFPPQLNSSDFQLNQLGATAVARCAPTNSVADVSTFLGELLHDGLPAMVGAALWKDRTDAARKLGNEYLNVQFGWQPFVSDIKKIATAVIKARSVLEQYERDAGKVVRRHYNFPPERSVTETVLSGSINKVVPLNSQFVSGTSGAMVREREITRRQWFSGAFTYYLPSGYDSRNRIDRAALEAEKLFGASLSPEVVWNLAPWSWAVDWFSNVGDVVHNFSAYANQGLIMRYGYIMEHTIVRDTYSCGPFTNSHLGGPSSWYGAHIAPMTFVTETKIRRQANPFGFGVSWSGLSPFQSSILAALGITRRSR